MTLTSIYFLIMIIIGLVMYYVLPKSWQWVILLIMSLVFYCLAGTPYTYVYVCVSSFVTFVCTNVMTKLSESKKTIVLVIALVINIGLWFVVKAKALWVPIVSLVFPSFSDNAINIVAALGMGYYTLQLLGYIIDCYWGNVQPLKNPLKVLLVTSFFPQMITGPISRHEQFMTLFREHKFSYVKITQGAQRVLYGFFKKLVIAEKLAIIAPTITDHIWYYNGFYTWIALFIYPIYIYADFSGCTDIAIGVAEMFGVVLPENFNNPFFSRSSQEFWQRWHITLGSWAKDYVLYPLLKSNSMVKLGKKLRELLGKKKGKFVHTAIGMFVLWMVMGIWHGSLRHIVGVSLWYWIVLMSGDMLAPCFGWINKKLEIKISSFSWHLFQSIRTYFIFSVGSTFFCYGVSFALTLLSQCANVILKNRMNPWIFFDGSIYELGITREECSIVLLGIILMLIVAILREKYGYARSWVREQGFIFRWLIWIIMFVIIVIFGNYGPGYDSTIFIYQGF